MKENICFFIYVTVSLEFFNENLLTKLLKQKKI